jgi:HPt (histidine-containing phosphotransfer) domain-containing protein
MIPGDDNFRKLKEALEGGNLDAAFEAAHALKGSSGNLALTPIYAPVSEMTDLLRARIRTDYTEGLKAVLEARDRLQAICGE